MKRLYDAAVCIPIHVRVTPAQKQDILRVAQENDMDVSTLIRTAVDEFVADYRERRVFRSTSGHAG